MKPWKFPNPRSTHPLLGAVIVGLTATLALSGNTAAPPTHTLKLRPLSDREQVIHVLNRLGFGAKPGEVDAIVKIGWKKWVETQLRPDAIADEKLDQRVARDYPSLNMTLDQTFDTYQPKFDKKAETPDERKKQNNERNRLRSQLETELKESVLIRATYSERRLKEVMVEFWRNHLNVDINKVQYQANNYEEQVIRKFAFGKFEDLLLASAKHPAMLIYLDNYVSKGKALNENYAREVMELHTLGVDNGYTQKDVTELARVLTGWTCGKRKPVKDASGNAEYGFIYSDGTHDHAPATVLGVQLDGKDGLADGEKMLKHLANHPNTARFIAKKLCVYLIDDNPAPELIDRVAKVFLDTHGDLPSVYREIILSPDFIAPERYKAKFKTPFEYVVTALRATGAEITSAAEVRRELKLMGEAVYECTNPTGYYDQAEAWLDPGVMVYRWNFAIQLVTDKIKGVKIDHATFEPWQRLAAADRLQHVIDMILGGRVDTKTRDQLSRIADVRGQIALALGSPSFQAQ